MASRAASQLRVPNPRLFRPNRLFAPTAKGEPVRRLQDVFSLYELGRIHALKSLQAGRPKREYESAVFICWGITTAFTNSSEINHMLPASVGAAKSLERMLHEFLDNAEQVSFPEKTRIEEAVINLENLLQYELPRLQAFIIEKHGLYDRDDLLEHAERGLLDFALSVASERTRYDLNMAGRCLTFDLFTASGFHAVRALEAIARDYYKLLTGKDAHETGIPLGPVCAGLEDDLLKPLKLSSNSPLGLIIGNLRRLNNIYRKPLSHRR